MKTFLLPFIVLLVFSAALPAQTIRIPTSKEKTSTISGDKATIYIPRRVKIQNAIAKIDEKIKQDLSDFTQQMREENRISKNVHTDVTAEVITETTDAGEEELNLRIEYKYEVRTINASISNSTEDFPPGQYNLFNSNAARITMTMLKRSIEDQLMEYLLPGTKVTVRITGSTDATPVNGKIPYKGEYGEFEQAKYYLNGMYEQVSITKASGITSNAQLAFLRTHGVREFVETQIIPLQSTDNNFQHYAVISDKVGGAYRRISVELIIHDAFQGKFMEEETAPAAPQFSDVDQNIPSTGIQQPNTYALIIGNEDYSKYQPGLSTEQNAYFAVNDAFIFKQYCLKTLGIPAANITYATDATKGKMEQAINTFARIIEATKGQAEVLVYYSGHGLPDEKNNEPYLIPVDISSADISKGIRLQDLYAQVTKYPSKRVTVFIDACFSGGARSESLLKVKGVRVRPKSTTLSGNIIVFTSSSGNEYSTIYEAKQHGMFTYFLLKKIQETRGQLTYRELHDYLQNTVNLESLKVNAKTQNPTFYGSEEAMAEWETWKLLEE